MKFWFTTTALEGQYRENSDFVSKMVSRVQASGIARYQQASAPAQADVIVFFEPNYHKDKKYPRLLLSNPLVREFPNKCFTVDYEDGPIGFLPGVYVGMPRSRMDHLRFRAGCYMGQYNTLTTQMADQRHRPPELLFSFRGSASSEVRKQLFNSNIAINDGVIKQTFAWFDHSEDDKHAYVKEILNSKFVLCPRGLSTVSIRLFETMELGRVPVILSDDWVQPDGPSWPQFSLRLSESRMQELPDLLREYEPYAAEMGQLARLAWEEWFSPKMRGVRTLEYIEDIARQRPVQHNEAAIQAHWLSTTFAWKQGWTPPQSLYRNVRQGTLVNKIKAKLLPRGASGVRSELP
jgi:hypothetical protein